jgi:hypothetical protein
MRTSTGGAVGVETEELTREEGLAGSSIEGRQMLDLFESTGADRFVLTWRTMDEQVARVRKHWQTRYIQRQLPELLAEAGRDQLNLFVRPYSLRTSFIQLDDLTPERAAELAPLSFLTLQTSPAKAQAWIATPAGGNPDDDRDFRRRVKKAVHSDPMASGSVRIAGSLNFKGKYAPNFPRVTITHAAPGLLVLREALEDVGLVAAPEPPPAVFHSPSDPLHHRKTWPDYQQVLAGAPPNQDKSGPDRSLADFTWCITALSLDWKEAEVAAKLRQVSEKAAAQGERYALATTRQAARTLASRRR